MIDSQRMGTGPLASLLVSFYRIWRGALKLQSAGYMLSKLAPFYDSLSIYSMPQSPLQPALRSMIAVSKKVGNLKAAINRRRGKLIMCGLACVSSWLSQHLEELGFRNIELRTFQVRSNQSWHDFVLAEKGAI